MSSHPLSLNMSVHTFTILPRIASPSPWIGEWTFPRLRRKVFAAVDDAAMTSYSSPFLRLLVVVEIVPTN